MGAWGIKALERDEGLDVLDILKNEYVPEHPVMDLGEMIELMKEEVMLGSDFSQIDFLFDNTAMALAELYFQWKDIALPADWKLDQESMKDEKWYWPIRLLKSLARLPINCDSWLGHGHTVENREPFADNTKLCTAMVIPDMERTSSIATRPNSRFTERF